jgi:hypothetical protein
MKFILTLTLLKRKYKLAFMFLIERIYWQLNYISTTLHHFVHSVSFYVNDSWPLANHRVILNLLFNVFAMTYCLLSSVSARWRSRPNNLPHICRENEHWLGRIPVGIHKSIEWYFIIKPKYCVNQLQWAVKLPLQSIHTQF